MVGGIDDAGRGSIIGPLVIAGVALTLDAAQYLASVGVKDSKLLSPSTRARLFNEITRCSSRIVVTRIEPAEVDRYVRAKKFRRLNYLEAVKMGEVASQLGSNTVYVDASDIDPERFRSQMQETLAKSIKIVAAHHAERMYPVVAAASVVAKVSRDMAVEELRTRYGDFGSGYPSDDKTIAYLRRWVSEKGFLPPFARKSWKTWKKITQVRLQ